MLLALTRRVLTEARPKVVAKFVYNFGVKGIRSVELHKRRRRRGENFPPFLFISVISSCQLRCQGCWVDVAAPSQKLSLDELNQIVGDAKAHGNAYFGILGGEPFLHPELLDLRNSGDTAGDQTRVVGYAAFAFTENTHHAH